MKWTYKVIYRRSPLEEDELNRLGEEGWELCGIKDNVAVKSASFANLFDSERIVYYFKRQKV